MLYRAVQSSLVVPVGLRPSLLPPTNNSRHSPGTRGCGSVDRARSALGLQCAKKYSLDTLCKKAVKFKGAEVLVVQCMVGLNTGHEYVLLNS